MSTNRAALIVIALALAAVVLPLATARAPSAAAQESGWVIYAYDVDLAIQEDGTVDVTERIAVDFESVSRHGIFRDLPLRYTIEGDDEHLRRVPLSNFRVTGGDGEPIEWKSETPRGGWIRLRIGDPDVLVTGEQTYVISYTVERGLTAFDTHDEFFWDAIGDQWGVPILAATVRVTAPVDIERLACYVGSYGLREDCESTLAGPEASFDSGRYLVYGEGMTVVIGLPSGLVRVDPPLLVDAPKDAIDQLGLNAKGFGLAGVFAALTLGIIGREWFVRGRDGRYRTVYELTQDEDADSAAVFQHETIVVEYTPPDDILPAELGVLLDQRANTIDVSATIIHLAVRGYLTITETEKTGWIFGSTDYELVRTGKDAAALEPYERQILNALFEDVEGEAAGAMVQLSELKNKFHEDLAKAKSDLYDRSVRLKHFPRNPETVRTIYLVAGGALAAAGAGAGFLLGKLFEVGIAGAGIALGGLVLMGAARWMPRRTPKGRALYRRALGFKLFIEVAEKDRQKFYEDEGIFERYLPYAMVFGSVKKWAKVFERLDIEIAEPSFYHGNYGTFRAAAFVSSLNGFGGTLSSVMASSPSSGGSGFGGGGGSGGGFGGGGGGSW